LDTADWHEGTMNSTTFNIYALFLLFSGAALIVLTFLRGRNPYRLLNGIVGAGFLVYGIYLIAFFHGGTVTVFWYVFIVPILLIARYFHARSTVTRADIEATQSWARRPYQPTNLQQSPSSQSTLSDDAKDAGLCLSPENVVYASPTTFAVRLRHAP
jgi:hypothetical protein